jgi:hypothetical protein
MLYNNQQDLYNFKRPVRQAAGGPIALQTAYILMELILLFF